MLGDNVAVVFARAGAFVKGVSDLVASVSRARDRAGYLADARLCLTVRLESLVAVIGAPGFSLVLYGVCVVGCLAVWQGAVRTCEFCQFDLTTHAKTMGTRSRGLVKWKRDAQARARDTQHQQHQAVAVEAAVGETVVASRARIEPRVVVRLLLDVLDAVLSGVPLTPCHPKRWWLPPCRCTGVRRAARVCEDILGLAVSAPVGTSVRRILQHGVVRVSVSLVAGDQAMVPKHGVDCHHPHLNGAFAFAYFDFIPSRCIWGNCGKAWLLWTQACCVANLAVHGVVAEGF